MGYSAEEYGRKFGSAPLDISNSIEGDVGTKLSAEAKEEGSLVTTVVELALRFVPTLINLISGETGPSQTDRIIRGKREVRQSHRAGDGGGDSGADWVHQQGRGQRDGEAGHRGCIPGHLPRPGPRHA